MTGDELFQTFMEDFEALLRKHRVTITTHKFGGQVTETLYVFAENGAEIGHIFMASPATVQYARLRLPFEGTVVERSPAEQPSPIWCQNCRVTLVNEYGAICPTCQAGLEELGRKS